jgi:hypothetical protein
MQATWEASNIAKWMVETNRYGKNNKLTFHIFSGPWDKAMKEIPVHKVENTEGFS